MNRDYTYTADYLKKRRMKQMFHNWLISIAVAGLIIFAISMPMYLGIYGFGPTNVITTRVTRMYVDVSKEGSHYMVGTENGVFEVSNGIILGMWNADQIYARLKEGKSYTFTTKGECVANFFLQQYPYVLDAVENNEPEVGNARPHPEDPGGKRPPKGREGWR